MTHTWRLALPLLLALLGAGALPGEETPPAAVSAPAPSPAPPTEPQDPVVTPIFSDETESVLVEVPVEVLAGGRPVFGLSAQDFEVYDNGHRQEILGVDSVDRHEQRDDDRLLPVAARRHFLLLFDLSFTSPGAVARAREAALQAVEHQLEPSDLVGVATFRLKEGVRLLLGFSPDRSQVRVTLDALEQVKSLDLRPDPLRLYLGQPAPTDTSVGRPDLPAEREEAYAHLQHLIDREAAARSRRDVAVLSESLASLARLLRGAAGRKHLLFFSEGFDGRLLTGDPTSEREDLTEAIRRGDLARVDSDALFGSRATRDLLGRLTEEMRRADCSLHTIDTSPLGQGKGKDGLFLLARDTGAVFFENHHLLGPTFAELLERTRLTYLITYRPTDPLGDGSYRKLKVKLRGPLERELGARLSYRPGYFDAELAAFTEEERRLLLADRLLDRRPGRIKTRVHALPTGELMRGKRYVPVVVEVAGDSFLEGRDDRKAPVLGTASRPRQVLVDAQIFVYALNEDGGIADFFSQAIPFDLARHGTALERRGFKLFAPLLLPTGRFTLRALVRNSEAGHLGVASKHVSVAKTAPKLRVPDTLIDPEWLLVRADRRDLAELGPAQDALEHLREARRRQEQEGAVASTPEGQPESPNDRLGPQHLLYQETLAALAEKPWHEALDALERFEVSAVEGDPQARAPRLGRTELTVAKALATEGKKSFEALWPLIGAHHDLYFRHRSAHRPFLEQQSRLLVRALAELAAELGDDALQLAAAQALASIGSTLLYEGRSAGFELLERALELDPANEAAHLSLAAYYEKFGGPYEKAVSWLDQLVLRRPESREGRLRLAINLLRLKGPAASAWPQAREDAVQHFGRLLADPQNDWITSLAAQELARFHRGEPDKAVALLEDALARRPSDPEILIQLTYLYDRLEQPERSRELAQRLNLGGEVQAAAAQDEGGARGRYNQWISETLIAARRDLRDGATGRVGVFRRAPVPAEGASR